MNVSRQFTFLLATAGIAISVNIAAAQQALRVAINASGLPFSGFNSDTKTAEGATVEVISAVAQDAGLSISFVPLNFAAFGPSLEAKSVDVVAATFGPTPERRKIADFTRAYATFRDAAVVSAKHRNHQPPGAGRCIRPRLGEAEELPARVDDLFDETRNART